MLRKPNKATLSKELKMMGSNVENILPRSSCIIGATSFVQETIGNHKTFAQVAKEFFLRIMNEGKEGSRIDIINKECRTIKKRTMGTIFEDCTN